MNYTDARDALFTMLRRKNKFLYFAFLEMHHTLTTEGFHATIADGRKVVNIDTRAFDGEASAILTYNIKNLSALNVLAFILGHEIAHHLLGHTTKSVAYEIRHAKHPKLTWLAQESQTNANTVKLLGYKMPDVAKPLDAQKPVWTWSGDYGVDPMGKHWVDIYEELLSRGVKESDVPCTTIDCLPVAGSAEDGTTALIQRALGKAAGTNCGDFQKFNITKDKPPIPFEAMLRFAQQSLQQQASSWRSPNKKGIPLRGNALKDEKWRLLLFVDTSASVTQEMLEDVVSRLARVSPAVECTVMWFDTVVYPDQLCDAKTFNGSVKIPGRGGTDFKAPASWWRQNGSRYDYALCVTDGEAELPAQKLHKWAWLIHTNGYFPAQEKVYYYKGAKNA